MRVALASFDSNFPSVIPLGPAFLTYRRGYYFQICYRTAAAEFPAAQSMSQLKSKWTVPVGSIRKRH
jgi:hypothetical protein